MAELLELPEQKHETLNEVSKVVVPSYLRIRREGDVSKHLSLHDALNLNLVNFLS